MIWDTENVYLILLKCSRWVRLKTPFSGHGDLIKHDLNVAVRNATNEVWRQFVHFLIRAHELNT